MVINNEGILDMERQSDEPESNTNPPLKVETSSLDKDFEAPLPGDPDFIGPIQQQ
jgi:hypothetical protein